MGTASKVVLRPEPQCSLFFSSRSYPLQIEKIPMGKRGLHHSVRQDFLLKFSGLHRHRSDCRRSVDMIRDAQAWIARSYSAHEARRRPWILAEDLKKVRRLMQGLRRPEMGCGDGTSLLVWDAESSPPAHAGETYYGATSRRFHQRMSYHRFLLNVKRMDSENAIWRGVHDVGKNGSGGHSLVERLQFRYWWMTPLSK